MTMYTTRILLLSLLAACDMQPLTELLPSESASSAPPKIDREGHNGDDIAIAEKLTRLPSVGAVCPNFFPVCRYPQQ
jgi:hypothetical protein